MTNESSPAGKARSLLKAKDTAGAVAVLEAALEADPADRTATEMLGVIAFRLKRHEQARDMFRQLTRLDPRDSGAWVNLGAVLNVLKDHKGASDALRKAIQRDKDSAIAYYNLGIAQKAMDQPKMAISAYQECLRLEPENSEATINLVNLYLSQKKFPQAGKAATAGLEHQPKSARLKALLKKSEDGAAGVCRDDSPFGRLVSEEDLARNQKNVKKRELTLTQRNQERNYIREAVRELRHAVRPIVPLLDKDLHEHMHTLHMSVFQQDDRYDGFGAYEGFVGTVNELSTAFEAVAEGIRDFRAQLHKTDPGL